MHPAAGGLPYYSPPKPRTPRKQSKDNGSDGTIENGIPDSKVSPGMELDENGSRYGDTGMETAVSKPGEQAQQSGDLIQKQSGSRLLHGMETETPRIDDDVLESGPRESFLQNENTGSDSSTRDAPRRPLRNSLVKRQLLSGDKIDAASTGTTSESHKQPTATKGVTETRPLGRSRRRSTNFSSQSLDSVSPEQAVTSLPSTGSQAASFESEVQFENQTSTSLDAEPMNTSPTLTKDAPTQEPSELGEASETANASSMSSENVNRPVVIDRRRLLAIFEQVARVTGSYSIEDMEKLHSTFEHLVFRHRMKQERSQLVEVS